MTQSMLRRTLKNLVQNFSEAEVKVREATSNDPWGPSSSQMSDISDLTYNVVACNEIMAMLWKRLNDDKNWRHVYKSLTLLEYLLKTGSDRIPKQSQENIHVVKPLVEYRFIDKDGKDQGVNVREKAKIVMMLIEDEEKRKEEREFAMKTKDKLANAAVDPNEKAKAEIPPYTGLPSLDNIPSVADLTASMAKKKEEQRKLEEKRREEERRAKEGDPDLWEQAATSAPPSGSDPWGAPSDALKDTGPASNDPWGASTESNNKEDSNLASSDPWGRSADGAKDSDVASSDPWGGSADGAKDSSVASNDPWGGSADTGKQSPPTNNDPWGDTTSPKEDKSPPTNDPWGSSNNFAADTQPANSDPWGSPSDFAEGSAPASSAPSGTSSETTGAKPDPWGSDLGTSAVSPTDPFGNGTKAANDPWGATDSPLPANDPWGAPAAPAVSSAADPFGDGGSLDAWGTPANSAASAEDSKRPASFLEGAGASLVDLDSLMSVKPKPKQPPLKSIPSSGQKEN
ncbi:epsin-1 [Astyanax mexicanus]|uniref:epsin-1 n=1 Tax=Astyanax mexicanus TaxID=7994 RepID=UPI0020CABFC7|nr:epsin-1 [Astyanax mexicanus]